MDSHNVAWHAYTNVLGAGEMVDQVCALKRELSTVSETIVSATKISISRPLLIAQLKTVLAVDHSNQLERITAIAEAKIFERIPRVECTPQIQRARAQRTGHAVGAIRC